MFSEVVTARQAVLILDMKDTEELAEAVRGGEIKVVQSKPAGDLFLVGDLVLLKLAKTIQSLGVDAAKAARYSEAVLGQRLSAHHENPIDWIENETHELFCLVADNQLARIFLRNKEDSREVDVGAIKPVLLPTTKCEINVFRVIRPVIYRARQVLSRKGPAGKAAP
ncbi:MAG: hypothetical protein FJY85_18145 [Deltaproteobacteria bacterium]|nr:hypothetical protein [Deltaproteobacteria bacterium]